MSISYFDNFNEFDFEVWLKSGLEAYLLEDAGAWAFPGADGEIAAPRNISLEQGLHESYRQLTAEQRKRYRLGLANLLASLEPSRRNIPIFEHLLSLASALPAPEILRVLSARVGNGFFGQLKDEEGKEMFSQIILTVSRFAAPRSDLLKCLNDLIHNSQHFDIAYSGLVLEALCRVDPDGFCDHMTVMREPLRKMFEEFQVSDEEKRSYATSMLDIIGLQRMVRVLPRLKYFDWQYEDAAVDSWLAFALFSNANSPLACERTLSKEYEYLYVFRRDNSVMRQIVPEDGENFLYLIDVLQDIKPQVYQPLPVMSKDAEEHNPSFSEEMDLRELMESFGCYEEYPCSTNRPQDPRHANRI